MRIKICGITNLEDAAAAVKLGADALGFNFFPASPRFVAPDAARKIVDRLPPFVTAVGVFVNAADPAEPLFVARQSGVRVIQLHGDETPDFCARLRPWPLIKALRVGREVNLELAGRYPVSAILLDTQQDNVYGGTGRSFDWPLAAGLCAIMPVILAGGLRPDNVADAIRQAHPYAVDVCSGVERSPGRKDPDKIRAFMQEVRNATHDRS